MPAAGDAYTRSYRRYEETVVPGQRLGRIIMRDSRSAAYPFAVVKAVPVVSVEHTRHIPILNQGDLGSCEGHAETGCVGTDPIWAALPTGHPALDEDEAVKIYELATTLDGYPGAYPPTDTGTDSTSASKAAQRLGLIGGYTHAAALNDLLQALMGGPVNFAFDWYDSFDTPDKNGLVAIGKTAGIRGGHALCARKVDADAKLIWLDNSWGTGWGAGGRFCMSYDTAAQLLAQDGEAVVPTPVSVPVPPQPPTPPTPPGPGPVPDPLLVSYLNDPRLTRWSGRRHTGDNAYAASCYRALRKAENA